MTAVFALGFVVSDPNEAVTVLYTLPIAMIALALGAGAGVVAALVALALTGLWATIDDVDIGVLGYVTRGTCFLLLGGVLGHFATRLRSAYDTVRQREQQLQ